MFAVLLTLACLGLSSASQTVLSIASDFQVNNYTESEKKNAAIASLSDGGYVIVWESIGQDGDALEIFAQIFSNTSVKVGDEFQVNNSTEGTQWNADVAALTGGGFVTVWDSVGQDGVY